MGHYSTIEKKETVLFAGETLELEIIALTKIKTRVGKTGTNVLPSLVRPSEPVGKARMNVTEVHCVHV